MAVRIKDRSMSASDRAKLAKPSRKTLLKKLADKQERERKREKV